jgi:hypothetical protein
MITRRGSMAAYKKKEIRAPYLHDAHLVDAQQHEYDSLPAVSMQGDSTQTERRA